MPRLAILLFVVALALTGCIGSSNELTVSVKLQCENGVNCEYGSGGQGCRGLGGYRDLRDGMKITVRDGDGNVLATDTMTDFDGICNFTATLEVDSTDHYQIEVGSRKPFTISKDEAEQDEWDVQLTIGSYS